MSNLVPVLETDKTLHFSSPKTFAEAVSAVVSGEWLMVAPKATLKLREEFPIVLVLDGEGLEVEAIADPFYWRGPYLGMQVRAANPAAMGRAKQYIQDILIRPDSEPGPEPEPEPELAPEPESEPTSPAEPAEMVPPAQGGDPSADQGLSDADIELDEPTEPSVELPPELVAESHEEHDAPDSAGTPIPMEPPTSPEVDPDETDLESAEEAAMLALEGGGAGVMPEPGPETAAADSVPSPPASPSPIAPPPRSSGPLPSSSEARLPPKGQKGPPVPSMQGTADQPYDIGQLKAQFPLPGIGLPMESSHSVYRLVSVLAANSASGDLEMTIGEETAHFYMRKGELLAIEPYGRPFDEAFAELLETGEFVGPDKLKEAMAKAEVSNKALALVLYEIRAVALDVMGRELRAMKIEMFNEMIARPEPVEYVFRAKPKFKRKFDPVRIHLGTMLVEFVRHKLTRAYAKHIEPLLDEFRFKYVQVKEVDHMAMELLGLRDKEKHAVKYILHGPNRLNESYTLCLMTKHGTARLIMALHHFGLISWLDEPGEVEGEETVESMLARTQRTVKEQNHFDRLEIHWAVHPTKIDKALTRMQKQYGPDGKLANYSDETRTICADIMTLITEAHSHLVNKRQRKNYRTEVQGERRIRLAADFLVKQSDLHRFRSDWDEAFELLESAADLIELPSIMSKLKTWREERGRR